MVVWCPPCSVVSSLQRVGIFGEWREVFHEFQPMYVPMENSLRITPHFAFQNMVHARDASKWVLDPDFSCAAMAPHMWHLDFKCPSKVAA